MWKYQGKQRPDFAIAPGPDQESVWDYPRPPALKRTTRKVTVVIPQRTLAKSMNAWRLMETASPPTYYVPTADIDQSALMPVSGHSLCEWKGIAQYYALRSDPATVVAWAYPESRAPFEALQTCLSFYPGRIDCFVDDEKVLPQPGEFYGGWITSDLVGPFKGEPGTGHW